MDTTSLTDTAREQSEKAASAPQGRAAVKVYGGSGRSLRQTVIALRSGELLAEHDSPGEATLHVLTGRVRLSGTQDSWEGGPGDLMIVPDERHSLEALEDAAVLLTVVARS